jgi:general secretion pathway protein G
MSSVRFHRSRQRGFTLMEIMAAVVIVGLLASIALPSYTAIIQRQKVQQAARDLQVISLSLESWHSKYFAYPENLSDLGMNLPKDPWGNDYEYLNFDSPAPGTNGKIRKDHNLHPLNTGFDLYSKGEDGQSAAPLTASASQDDVIYARDGGFVGLASDF